MKYLISFANETFKKSQKNLEKTAYTFGVDKCISYSPKSYANTDFYKENKYILDQKRGAGYWLWKPYIILETLKTLQEDDVLLYLDSGMEIISDISPLYDLCKEQDIVVFEHSGALTCEKYTQKRTFELMNTHDQDLLESKQLLGGFYVSKKTNFSIQFVEEWLTHSKNPEILMDSNTPELEAEKFIAHRHDQSILSILAFKYNISAFRDPSQYGNGDLGKKSNSTYGQLINLHRSGRLRHNSTFWKFIDKNNAHPCLAPLKILWNFYKRLKGVQ